MVVVALARDKQPTQKWRVALLSEPTVTLTAVARVVVQVALALPTSTALAAAQPLSVPARSTPSASAPL